MTSLVFINIFMIREIEKVLSGNNITYYIYIGFAVRPPLLYVHCTVLIHTQQEMTEKKYQDNAIFRSGSSSIVHFCDTVRIYYHLYCHIVSHSTSTLELRRVCATFNFFPYCI